MMVIALYVIALAMIGGGAASIAYGYGIVLNERGWTMVISGATVLAGGVVLLGIAVVAGRVRGVERGLADFPDHAMRVGAGSPSPRSFEGQPAPEAEGPPPAAERRGPVAAVGQEEQALLKAADIIPGPGPPEPPMRAAPPREEEPAEPETSGPAVVGTYNSGGNSYV